MEIETLVQTINDDPDRLHLDYTPSVLKLSELGLPAAKAVLDLLDAPEFLTRKRAQRVLEGVVMRLYGWVPGLGYTDPHEGQKKTQDLLKANGNYRADASPDERRNAIGKWRRWIETQEKDHTHAREQR